MNKYKISVAMAALAFAAAGCSTSTPAGAKKGDHVPGGKKLGAVEFNLDLEDSMGNVVDTVDTIDLNLMCAGINQDHEINVTSGNATANFGGLPPGLCNVTLTATTNDTHDTCTGSSPFTVIAGQVVEVPVTLYCNGSNGDEGGGAVISGVFDFSDCPNDRILKIWAIPGNVATGSSTTANVEFQNLVGAPTVTWAIANDADNRAIGSTGGVGTCDPGSQSCQIINCDGIGANPGSNADGEPTNSLWATVTVVDDECSDTERVRIDCVQQSVCGNGVREGAEQCDGTDGLLTGQICSAGCTITPVCGNSIQEGTEQCDDGPAGSPTCSTSCTSLIPMTCGNNIQEGTEVCDGTDVDPGFTCAANCLSQSPTPPTMTCGNNIQEGTEVCDGTDVDPGFTCAANCLSQTPTPPGMTCGNNIQEGTEVCDGTDVDPGFTCAANCLSQTPIPPSNVCRDCIEDPAGVIGMVFGADLAACNGNSQCNRALDCFTETFCANGTTVAECFCGYQANPDTCLNGTVAATGFCHDLVIEVAGAGLTPADYINFMVNPANPVGAAYNLFAITDDPDAGCLTQCDDAPLPGPFSPF